MRPLLPALTSWFCHRCPWCARHAWPSVGWYARRFCHGGAALSQRGGLVAGRAGGHTGWVQALLWSTTTAPTTPPRWPAVTAPTWSPSVGPATGRRCMPGWRRRRRRSSRSSTPTGRWIPRNCPRWSTSSTAAPTWRSVGAGRCRGCAGRGTRGSAPRRCAGGCAPATGCRCTTSRRCASPAATPCSRSASPTAGPAIRVELHGARGRRGLDGGRTRCPYGPRTGGKSKVSGSLRGSIHAGLDFWQAIS